MNATHEFLSAMRERGLRPPANIEPGKFLRFPGVGKPKSNRAGWCKLFPDGLGGSYGCFATGLSGTWQAKTPRTPAEREIFREQVAKAQALAEREREAEYAKAKEAATLIWDRAAPAPESFPYLAKKGIQPHGARIHEGRLVIPVYGPDGGLQSLQYINNDGVKRFLPDGATKGGHFIINGLTNTVCIAEGFSTAASIHEATGYLTYCAFGCGNLEAISLMARDRHPNVRLIVCADDDRRVKGNPGLTAARQAAAAANGLLAIPDFEKRYPGLTDFNDLMTAFGLGAVRLSIEAAQYPRPSQAACLSGPPEIQKNQTHSKVGVSGVSGVQSSIGAASRETPARVSGVSGVSDGTPPMEERPCFRVFDTEVKHDGTTYRAGVWHFGQKTGKRATPTESWVCSPLHIEAVTFDAQENNFGRLLRFKNTLGRWREWAMPMELLRGSGEELRGELFRLGLEIDTEERALLNRYLQDRAPERRMRCALQVGWCGNAYVLPDTVIGQDADGIVFQGTHGEADEYTTGGTLDGWRNEVSARAVGNPLLMVALSAAFAGPLLARCNAEGGGLHFVGDSSTGKTTLLEAACSVWGGSNYRRSWRATANGMEAAAMLFSDSLLALDEISECDPREVGSIVYALGNGRGKQRAGRTGGARAVARWRCFVLSSGERTIESTMQEGGHRVKAGQSVRLLDIPAIREHGAWDNLHGLPSGAALADAIKRAAATHYGHAGRAFLERLTKDERDFCAMLERLRSVPRFAVDGGEGQEKRAAGRFALLALAGELATEYGITGWDEGKATDAASVAFRAWRDSRGRGNSERRQILMRVADFIDRHGDGRFSRFEDGDISVRERAGWWRDSQGNREYLFTSDGMREALKGFDFKRALDVLQEAGALPLPGADGRRIRFFRVGERPVRLYPVRADKLEDGEHGAG